jgi:hypothetical protein
MLLQQQLQVINLSSSTDQAACSLGAGRICTPSPAGPRQAANLAQVMHRHALAMLCSELRNQAGCCLTRCVMPQRLPVQLTFSRASVETRGTICCGVGAAHVVLYRSGMFSAFPLRHHGL